MVWFADVPIGATATTSAKADNWRPTRTWSARTSSSVGAPGQVGHDEERSVHARAELLGDGGVCLVLRRRRATRTRRRAARGASTSPARTSDDAEHADAQQDAADGAPGRHRADRPRRASDRSWSRERRPLAAAQDPLTDETEQGRRQGDGDEHSDRDAGRPDGAHDPEERDARHVECEQGDQDGRAGEDDRVARGARREADGFVQAVAVHELAAVAMDDEQRIVDAHREPEHDAEHRCDRDHVDDARHRQRTEDADADADERAQDRQPGAGEGAEHQDQDDGGDEQADELADPDDAGDARGDLG